MKCVVWAGGLTLAQPSTEWKAYLLASSPRSPCRMREVGESAVSSADCLAALVASVIKGLRREEAGQATGFSKRAFSHFFEESFRCGDF